MAEPTKEQLNILSETARVAHLMGEAFDAARSLAETYQLSPDAATLFEADLSSDAAGTFKGLNLQFVQDLLGGIAGIGSVAASDDNKLRKATFALSARNV